MTILNSTPLAKPQDVIWTLLAILFLSLLFSAAMLWNNIDERAFIVIFVIFFIIGALIVIPIEYKKTKLNQLEVLFEKGYPIEDVYKKYNVKGRRGEIWILEEKEVNNSG